MGKKFLSLEEENKRDSEFRQIIKDLSRVDLNLNSDSTKKDFIERLISLYKVDKDTEKYRHFYSSIFDVLIGMSSESDKSMDTLSQNFGEIRNYYLKNYTGQKDVIHVEINRLFDHINLDVARITHNLSDYGIIKGSISELSTKSVMYEEQQKELVKDLDKAKTDYISILGIFAAVVLAFTGGIAFSTSILNNVHETMLSKLLSVGSLICLFLFNVIFILFDFIRYIKNGNDAEHGTKRDYKFFWPINLIFIFILVISSSYYCCNTIDMTKNGKADAVQQESTTVVSEGD